MPENCSSMLNLRGRVKCRQALPSPANLLLEIYNITEGKIEELYPSMELLVNDIAEAYNRTILHFHELGCDTILLDDTACGLMCDDIYTKRLLQGGVDLIELHRRILRLINASLVNIPEDMETSIYLSGGRQDCSGMRICKISGQHHARSTVDSEC